MRQAQNQAENRAIPAVLGGGFRRNSVWLKNFAFCQVAFHFERVTQPLALVFYEELMPGTQLAARLKDLNYRVQTFSDAAQISAAAESEGPMLVFVDLRSHRTDVPGLINQIRQRPTTAHIPVVALPNLVDQSR